MSASALPPVRNQGDNGTCWTFAAYGSLELNLAKSGKIFDGFSAPFDFSENHMNFLTSKYAFGDNDNNPLGFDRNISTYQYPTPPPVHPKKRTEGGNAQIATAYLTRWEEDYGGGPVLEQDDPYNQYPAPRPSNDPKNKLTPVAHVQNVLFIPDVTSKSIEFTAEKFNRDTQIKQSIMKYGAVMSSYYTDNNYYHKLGNTTSYYYPYAATNNHAITIIGWDDNYLKTNFKNTPTGNGAWLVRNSWGKTWNDKSGNIFGDEGYFYISYYDPHVGQNSAVFTDAELTTNYSRQYLHDPFGSVGKLGYSAKEDNKYVSWMLNKFEASDKNQELSAIGFYTLNQDTYYEIYATTLKSGEFVKDLDFTNTTPISAGNIDLPGYHTIKLNLKNQFTIKPNEIFAIAVKIKTDELYNIPLEYNPTPDTNNPQPYVTQATSKSDQSYTSPYGFFQWDDLVTANVCLRAYTIEDMDDFLIEPNLVSKSVTIRQMSDNPYGILILNLGTFGFIKQPFDTLTGRSYTYTLPTSIDNATSVNTFIWDSIEYMNPLSKKYNIK